MIRGRTSTGTLVGMILGGLIGACTPTLDFTQCRDDTDCTNAQGRDLLCRSGSCIDRPDPRTVECEVHTDCIDFLGEEHVCGVDNLCAALRSPECDEVSQPDGDPNDVVYIGSILATSEPFRDAILPIQNAVQLAVEDFNEVTSLPGGREIGWVGCDSRADASLATTAAQHLAEEVGVPAIVGPGFSGPLLEVAREVTIDAETFVISPTASAKEISNLNDDDLVWRTINSDVYQAPALADLVPLLDPLPERILVLVKDDVYGSSLHEDLIPRLEDTIPDANVASLVYDDPATFASNDELLSAYGTTISVGFAHDADTVVLLGTSEVRELILFYLSARDSMNPQPPLPRFVVSHGAVPILEQVVEEVAEAFRPTLMQFLFGTSPIIQDPANFESYNIRYKIRFSDEDAITASSLGYDSTLVALLGAAASKGPTGPQIAKQMSSLVDPGGVPIGFNAGIGFIDDARDVLVDDGTVDLTGVSGGLDFDVALGEVRTDLIGWQLLPRETNPARPVLTPTRQYVLDDAPAVTGDWVDL